MKFKLFGIMWDFITLIEMLWVFIGCFVILWPFVMVESPWYLNAIWIFILIIVMGAGDSINAKLYGMKNE